MIAHIDAVFAVIPMSRMITIYEGYFGRAIRRAGFLRQQGKLRFTYALIAFPAFRTSLRSAGKDSIALVGLDVAAITNEAAQAG